MVSRPVSDDPLLPRAADQTAARDDYHRLAFAVVGEARRVETGRFGLRATSGGFGTPEFGTDRRVRVDGATLVVEQGENVRIHEIGTLRAAADFVGISVGTEAREDDSPPLGDIDRPLRVSPDAGAFLGSLYRLAWTVLGELRERDDAVDAEPIQLWPGHFDAATAIGDESAGRRATFGVSPGDTDHPEPYVYVGPWGSIDTADGYWNASEFGGALLPYAEFRGPDGPAAVRRFLTAGFDRLAG